MKEIRVHTFNEIPYRFTGIVKFKSGTKRWYKNGKRHRLDGPAFISERFEEWYYHGKRHRLDGPAIESLTTDVDQEYWIDDIRYSKEEFDRKVQLIQQQLPKRNTDYKHLTDEQWYEYLNVLVIE